MSLTFQILGHGTPFPTHQNFTSAALLKTESRYYLFDCGEGTQIALSKLRIKRNRIRAVFITHLHGDHIYGLPGLITSLAHYQRDKPLNIYGPKGIQQFISTALTISDAHLTYKLIIKEFDANISTGFIVDNLFEVTTLALDHRIPSQGYLLKELHLKRNFDGDKLKKYNLSVEQIISLKEGNSIEVDGKIILTEDVCLPMRSSKQIAYCSDTAYNPALASRLMGVDLIYHEATYLDELADLAKERGHSTAKQAASLAKAANAKKLVIGHFSSRYRDTTPLEKEAKSIFLNTIIAQEGLEIEV